MTEFDRLDRDLAMWFTETAAPRVPDYVDDILRQTAPVRQRSRWTFPERWLPMSVVTLGRQTRRTVPWRTIGAVAALILVLLIGAVIYVGSQRRVPPPFGLAANGSIAYVRTIGGYENRSGYHEPFGDIVAVDPGTGQTAEIVGGPELDGQPVYALDGMKLSFVRQVVGGYALFAVDSGGGSPTRLTKDPLPAIREAAWSPDGRKVAFTVGVDGRSDLWLAQADGSGARRLDVGVSAIAPQWRPPDGQELLFVGSAAPGLDKVGAYHGLFADESGTGLALYRIRPDTGAVRQIVPNSGSKFDFSFATWTPDGQRIVTQNANAIGDTSVVVLDPDGNPLQRFAADLLHGSAIGPVVSPDGRRVAYALMDAIEHWHLRVESLDASASAITSDHEFVGGAAVMRWSPDGTELIVNHHFDGETWRIDSRTGIARRALWSDPGSVTYQRVAESVGSRRKKDRGGSRRSRLVAVPVKESAGADASATRQGHLSRRLHRLP